MFPGPWEVLFFNAKLEKILIAVWFPCQAAMQCSLRQHIHLFCLRLLETQWFLRYSVLGQATGPVRTLPAGRSVLQHHVPSLLIDGLLIWILALPAVKDLLICFCRLLRKRPENFCLEALKNALTLLLILCPLVMLLASYGFALNADMATQRLLGNAIFAGSVLILSICNCLLATMLKALLKRPGW